MNNANPSLRMQNTTHYRDNTLCDQIDDFLQPTKNDETFLNTGDNSDHFLFYPHHQTFGTNTRQEHHQSYHLTSDNNRSKYGYSYTN